MNLPDQMMAPSKVPACGSDVLEQIRQAVIEGSRAIGHGGLEVGGVLLGRASSEGLSVEASLPLSCEHAFGPSLRLSGNDDAAISQLIGDTAGALGKLEAVGWYRSYTRSEMAVKEGDRAVLDRHFPQPGRVLLLLKPVGVHTVSGAFFVRDAEGELVPAGAEALLLRPSLDFLNQDAPPPPAPGGQEVAVAEPSMAVPARRGKRAPRLLLVGVGLAGLAAVSMFAWQRLRGAPEMTLSIAPANDGSHAVVVWNDTDRSAERGRITLSDEVSRFSTEIPGEDVRRGLAIVPLAGGELRVTVKIWDANGAAMEREARFDSAPKKTEPAREPENSDAQDKIAELTQRNFRLEQTITVLRERLKQQQPARKKLTPSRVRR